MDLIGRVLKSRNDKASSGNNNNIDSFTQGLVPPDLSKSFWVSSSRYESTMKKLVDKCPYILINKLAMTLPEKLSLDIRNEWSKGNGGVMGKAATMISTYAQAKKVVRDVISGGTSTKGVNNALSNTLYSQGNGAHLSFSFTWDLVAISNPVYELIVPYILLTAMTLPRRLSMSDVQLPGPVFGWSLNNAINLLSPLGVVNGSDIIEVGIGDFFSLKKVAISNVRAEFNTKSLTTISKNTNFPVYMQLSATFTTVEPLMSNDIPGLFKLTNLVNTSVK